MAKWWGRANDERLSVGFSHGKTKGTETQGILVQQCPALDVRLLLESWCATWEIMWNILPGIRSAWPTDFNFCISSPVTNRYIQCYKGTAMSCNVSRHPKPTPFFGAIRLISFSLSIISWGQNKGKGKVEDVLSVLIVFFEWFSSAKSSKQLFAVLLCDKNASILKLTWIWWCPLQRGPLQLENGVLTPINRVKSP